METMDKDRMIVMGYLYTLLAPIQDQEKQKKILSVLETNEGKMRDNIVKDFFQKAKRKKLDYYGKVASFVDDILETNLTQKTRPIVIETLKELQAIVIEQPKDLWSQIIEWFNNATGKH